MKLLKGSKQAKEHMQKIRSFKGKGASSIIHAKRNRLLREYNALLMLMTNERNALRQNRQNNRLMNELTQMLDDETVNTLMIDTLTTNDIEEIIRNLQMQLEDLGLLIGPHASADLINPNNMVHAEVDEPLTFEFADEEDLPQANEIRRGHGLKKKSKKRN